MKRCASLLAIIVLLAAGCTTQPLSYMKKPLVKGKNVAVLPFEDYIQKNNSGQMLTNIFTIYFLQKGFNVAEREKINQVLKEKGLELTGLSGDAAKEMGSLLNVDYLLIGAVTDYTAFSSPQKLFYLFEWMQIICSVGATARLVDTATGEVLWVGIAQERSFTFKDAADDVVRTLFSTITF
jgi:curli biogenesis system outer membrane secretion channel CsgG